MTVSGAIKPTHKAAKAYREARDAYAGQGVTHEGATETAFQRLLEAAAKTYGWALVPKLGFKRGKHVAPDGTVRDANYLHRRSRHCSAQVNSSRNFQCSARFARGQEEAN